MRLVDAHCHLESEELRGCLDEVLAGARRAGVTRFITNAVEPAQWELSQRLALQHDGVSFAMGLHPWFVTEERLSRLGELEAARERGAAAIGEIGLDGKTDVPMDLQRRAFRRQAAIAHDIGLPVVIHSRNAFDVLQPELRELGPFEAGGLLHAFSGSLELAEEFLDLGLSFSMGRSLTYRNSTKRAKVLERIFPERLLLETDSPDMPPVEVEQGPNVPANLVYCLTAASETLGMGPEAVAEATTANAERLFRLED